MKLVNISTTGIGVQRAEPFPVDTVLTIQVDSRQGIERQARVVHATEQHNGTWIMGAALVEPFTEDEFRNLLAELSSSSRQ